MLDRFLKAIYLKRNVTDKVFRRHDIHHNDTQHMVVLLFCVPLMPSVVYVYVVNYLFMLSVVMLSVIMPSVMYAACRKLAIYAECRNAECHYAEGRICCVS